jgi:hypothetical protein
MFKKKSVRKRSKSKVSDDIFLQLKNILEVSINTSFGYFDLKQDIHLLLINIRSKYFQFKRYYLSKEASLMKL